MTGVTPDASTISRGSQDGSRHVKSITRRLCHSYRRACARFGYNRERHLRASGVFPIMRKPIPTGTITFLFTDIENSTRLWQEDADAMRVALKHHDSLLRHAVEANGGYVFKTIGDACCAAFSTAREALNAAIAAQIALNPQRPASRGKSATLKAHPSTPNHHLKVRMALHTGVADETGGDYLGATLSRVARMLPAGHGGQVLISLATEELLRDSLPADVRLKDLGLHRFKDLQRAEHIFQIVHPKLPSEFPKLQSLSEFTHNLPIQLTSFIGRETEIEKVKSLLETARLLTLTGTGGCGKTRLALQVAADMVDRYPDGVWLVELAALTDSSLVPQSIASVFDVKEQPGSALVDSLAAALREKTTLLVLDNCEHLIQSCADVVHALMRTCPNLRVIATTREALKVPGEAIWRVPSLLGPEIPAESDGEALARVLRSESVQLFMQRASSLIPGFSVPSSGARHVVGICRRLDGIPLAIELAAARVKVLSVDQIAERLDDRFRLLVGGDRTDLPRHQTLQATIDWSYDLLTEPERNLLCRLSGFAGGWSLEAAEFVCQGGSISDDLVLDLLSNLVDKSLVIADDAGSQIRYRMLETVREYARQSLAADEDAPTAFNRHVRYFCDLAEEALPHYTASDQVEWLARIECEHDNMRAAFVVCRNQPDLAETGLRLASALAPFWHVRGFLSEGRRRLAEAMSLCAENMSSHTWAAANNGAGVLARSQGDFVSARQLCERALTTWENLDDKRRIASALSNLGLIAIDDGDYLRAKETLQRSLVIREELGDKPGIAISLVNLGVSAWYLGDILAVQSYYERALELKRELGDVQGVAICQKNLGDVFERKSDFSAAQSLYQESLRSFELLGDREYTASTLTSIGDIAQLKGDLSRARSLYKRSVIIYRELGNENEAGAIDEKVRACELLIENKVRLKA